MRQGRRCRRRWRRGSNSFFFFFFWWWLLGRRVLVTRKDKWSSKQKPVVFQVSASTLEKALDLCAGMANSSSLVTASASPTFICVGDQQS